MRAVQGLIKAPDTEGQQTVAAFLLPDWSGDLTRTNLPQEHYFWMEIIFLNNVCVSERNSNTLSSIKIMLNLEQTQMRFQLGWDCLDARINTLVLLWPSFGKTNCRRIAASFCWLSWLASYKYRFNSASDYNRLSLPLYGCFMFLCM